MLGVARENLARLLEPCAPEEFLASAWGRDLMHVRGSRGKFSRLMPWSRLNDLLARQRLDSPRLRLTREGKPVPASAYLRHATGGRNKTPIPRLRAAELTSQLRDGATLVLDAVEELHAPLTELAESLELAFHERVQINLYAGWRTSHGFDLHWDDHDVFILQVAGRKRWRVYGETRPSPVANDIEPAPRPARDALWEDTLEDGDLLYLPRGWWHVAFPLDEPTLHLTVGVHKRTGLDLLRWLSDELRTSEAFRRDLPRDASPAELAAHVGRLRDELVARFDGDTLTKFFREHDANAEPRQRLSLPSSAMTKLSRPPTDALVCLTAPRPLDFDVRGDEISFSCNKKRWRFDARALPLLQMLDGRRVCRVAELCEAARGEIEASNVQTFVGELILHGLVAIVDE
ncbi:MAG TPA: cupin domain-containing protein [Pyrinomonadaceae bacterium]|nr:cupin domain-containing protein [Pyrinomonadaceae bacterium]